MSEHPKEAIEAICFPPYEFDRYINGTLMAEGVTIEREYDFAKAMRMAARIAPMGPNREFPVLVLTSHIGHAIAGKAAAVEAERMQASVNLEDAIREASIKSMDDAQKMILDHLDGCHAIYMMGKGRDPKKYTSKYSLAAGQLRAALADLKGETT